MRVVSTTCSNTEIVCALGCADMLVGVDDYSDYPEDVVASLPRVGPDLGVEPGPVVALKPDVVLASLTVPGHEKVVQGLEDAGLRVIAPEPTRLQHVYDDIRTLAAVLGVQARGEALVAQMQEQLVPRERVGEPPGILVEWWPKPVIAPGAQSWVTDLITLAGGRNPLGEEPLKSRPLSNEELVALDPDAVVISWCGVKPEKYKPSVVLERKGCGAMGAVRRGHVFPIPEAFLGRPGPRLVEGLRELRRVVESVGD